LGHFADVFNCTFPSFFPAPASQEAIITARLKLHQSGGLSRLWGGPHPAPYLTRSPAESCVAAQLPCGWCPSVPQRHSASFWSPRLRARSLLSFLGSRRRRRSRPIRSARLVILELSPPLRLCRKEKSPPQASFLNFGSRSSRDSTRSYSSCFNARRSRRYFVAVLPVGMTNTLRARRYPPFSSVGAAAIRSRCQVLPPRIGRRPSGQSARLDWRPVFPAPSPPTKKTPSGYSFLREDLPFFF